MSTIRIRWADLRPIEFTERLNACPIVYLPVGLCEPHGHVAALGLDMHSADALCDAGARLYGGIVAPTQALYAEWRAGARSWTTLNPRPGQHAVSDGSQWNPYEFGT